MSPCRIPVRSYELDSFAHVNNAVYLQYLETARSHWLLEMHMPFDSIAASGIQIVIARAEIDFKVPLRSSDTVLVHGTLTDLGPASIVWNYRLCREADLVDVAVATTKGVCIDPDSGRPRRWPEMFRTAFAGAVDQCAP
jgi:YbgC/YbaW family acyl-CoA thioester hydrolase